ncbi:endonuclease [Allobranchiibius sp. CTAmp26]|uniref:endonuclease n=1 Tax=Allobranchiibius sp. CTAmp26 TaxID=2815214 RepID=UPI001AA180AF|nr:endonuclease [Allobranchiibius sp. CTAmp26]MBO1756664.1 endonuclease [Allobranchiibius sp. CTAmp26]
MSPTQQQRVRDLLDARGRTFADEAGITLRDKPAALYQLLTLTTLFSVPISAGVAVSAARELFAAGWRTPARLLESTWQQRVDALGRGHYRRYDESTATALQESAEHLRDTWAGDLRRLRDDAAGDADGIQERIAQFPRIGPTGAAIFCREVQQVWPSVRPFFDQRARDGARDADLPTDVERLAALVDEDDLARFAAALVRRELT